MSESYLAIRSHAKNWLNNNGPDSPNELANSLLNPKELIYSYFYQSFRAYIARTNKMKDWQLQTHLAQAISKIQALELILDGTEGIHKKIWEDVDYEVREFSITRNIAESVEKTIEVYREVFGEFSEYVLYLLEDADDDNEDVEKNIVFEIRFEGDRMEFKRKFETFVKEWMQNVDTRDQEFIDFGFKIN